MFYQLRYTPERVPGGVVPDHMEMTRAPDGPLAVCVHAFDTLFGQPCGGGNRIVGLYPGKWTPGIAEGFFCRGCGTKAASVIFWPPLKRSRLSTC